jgi:large subunit ribosomal protein L9
MKVLLIKDVYNLGRGGEVKKVADGYARNFLLPQKLAVKVTEGALKQVKTIQEAAAKQRQLLNEEMGGLAEQITGLELNFAAKAGESGKLYGSITQHMIADAIKEKIGVEVDRHWVETAGLREVGEHMVRVRLTFDLIPEVKVIVVSEDEAKEKKKATTGKKAEKAATPESAEVVEQIVYSTEKDVTSAENAVDEAYQQMDAANQAVEAPEAAAPADETVESE